MVVSMDSMDGFKSTAQAAYHSRSETVAAISTPQAPGGIGIVRISGPDARGVAGKVFSSKSGKTLDAVKGYTALYGRVRDGDEIIDEAVALNFRAPASYTGEDVVELSCHGGLYVMRRVLQAVLTAGAAPASPGEFTRRAFLNGKLGLTEAESVMQLISAQGEQAARAALAGHEGVLEKRIGALKEKLLSAAAHLDAWADYPEDDVPQVTAPELEESLTESRGDLDLLLKQFDSGRALREGVDTVIAGRPNAGKSTLMNLLAGCERSIVTQYAGTTRDVVEDTVFVGGVPLRLADTAGIRPTEDPVEKLGVERAYARVRSAQLVLAVFDSSQELSEEDKKLTEELRSVPCIAVVNKSDLPEKIDKKYIIKNYQHIVNISALNGEGLTELTNAVSEVLRIVELNPAEGILFTERQRDAAKRAAESLDEGIAALKSGMTFDAVTVSVEDAVSALLELTGERTTDAVVDSVFSRFCVGK